MESWDIFTASLGDGEGENAQVKVSLHAVLVEAHLAKRLLAVCGGLRGRHKSDISGVGWCEPLGRIFRLVDYCTYVGQLTVVIRYHFFRTLVALAFFVLLLKFAHE